MMKRIATLIFSSLLFLISCSSIPSEKLKLSAPLKDSSYFPKEIDDYYGFSRILYQLNEPEISNIKKENFETYRLTSLVAMSGEIDVDRIIKKDNDIYLIKIRKNLNRSKTSKTKISLEKFEEFKSKLDSFQIQNFAPNISNSVDDGIQYSLEILDGKNYFVIFRNNPQTGKGADFRFLEVAKLFTEIKNNPQTTQ